MRGEGREKYREKRRFLKKSGVGVGWREKQGEKMIS